MQVARLSADPQPAARQPPGPQPVERPPGPQPVEQTPTQQPAERTVAPQLTAQPIPTQQSAHHQPSHEQHDGRLPGVYLFVLYVLLIANRIFDCQHVYSTPRTHYVYGTYFHMGCV